MKDKITDLKRKGFLGSKRCLVCRSAPSKLLFAESLEEAETMNLDPAQKYQKWSEYPAPIEAQRDLNS